MLALPFSVDESGAIATTSDANTQLTNRVYSVLSTQLGERVMLPRYGWDLNHYLFEPIDSIDEKHMFTLAQEAIQTWEPGASLTALQATKTDVNQLTIRFYFKSTSDTVITGELSFGSHGGGGVFAQVSAPALSNTAAMGG